MNEKIVEALYRAAILTFEELGFMLPVTDLDELQQYASPDFAARVDFHGPFTGHLIVQLGGGVLPILAANMLGEEKAPVQAMQLDALGEITNIVCGNLLPEIAGADKVFHLDAPFSCPAFDLPGVDAETPPDAEAHLGLEQGRADVLLFMEKTQG